MRFRKIFPFLAYTLFATIIASKYALAQEKQDNATPQATSSDTPVKIGGDVLPPVLTHSVEPKFPRGFRTVGTTAVVNVGLVVDTAGKPTKIHIVKSSNSGFDKNSMKAVAKYRFEAATLHGLPVPVELIVQVNFEVFDQMPPGGYHPPAEPPVN
jgi:TonB family protein